MPFRAPPDVPPPTSHPLSTLRRFRSSFRTPHGCCSRGAAWLLGSQNSERTDMKKIALAAGLGIALMSAAPTVRAHAPSGAIFTTVADGSEVNFNHYPS